jgi:hypothetical protein
MQALLNFRDEFPDALLYCFCFTEKAFEQKGIEFMHWKEGVLSVQSW